VLNHIFNEQRGDNDTAIDDVGWVDECWDTLLDEDFEKLFLAWSE
jgi:hypothetical protein